MFADELLAAPTPAASGAASAAADEPHRALYLRWRPLRFEEVVGQEHVTRTLRNASMSGRLAHAYLFTGPRGTGKTSVARILYRAANCDHLRDGDPCNECQSCRAALDGRAMDLVEIDAASNRGIDDVRDLRDKVAYRPAEGRYRLYILDEAHEFTPQAWDALLKTLEEPPAHAIFVLATTEAHKVPATIVSRCQRFDFRRIPFDACREQLARVAAAEGMDVEAAVFERIARSARGGLRDALSLLDQLTAFTDARVDMAVARVVLGLPAVESVRAIVEGLTGRDAAAVMGQLTDVAESGADLRQFVEELVGTLRALLLVRAGADARLATELPAEDVAWLQRQAPGWTFGGLSGPIQELTNALARTRDAQQFQVQVELALLGACDVADTGPVAVADARPVAVTEAADTADTGARPPAAASAALPDDPAGSSQDAPRAAPLAEPASPSPGQAAPAAAAPRAPAPASQAAASRDALVQAQDRWSRVVDYVRTRKPPLAAQLSSARPTSVDGDHLVVAFATDFNRKGAERPGNRQTIEDAVRAELGRAYRLRYTVGGAGDLFDDPVISYAVRTFGGEPRRVDDQPGRVDSAHANEPAGPATA